MRTYELDGERFDDLEGFWTHFGEQLGIERQEVDGFTRFHDTLFGGYGTPDEGFTLVWRNSARSRVALGYQATVAWLRHKLTICHEENRAMVRSEIEAAERGEGPTVFDIVVDIIREHAGPDDGGIELVLE